MKSKLLILAVLVLSTGFSCKPKTPAAEPQQNIAAQAAEKQTMIIAKVSIKPENVKDFINAAQTIIKSSNEEQGCIEYNLFQSPYDEGKFVFVEKYDNQAAIDFHFGQPYFKEFGTTIANWTAAPAEIKIYDITGERMPE